MKRVLIILSFIPFFISSCDKQEGTEGNGFQRIAFSIGDGFDFDAQTRVSVVNASSLDASGFKVNCVTGTPGSETQVWSNASFTKSGSVFVGNHYWPASSTSYAFYASNASSMTFNAAGPTISATNTTDIVCAYLPSPNYKETNVLTFKHIFARLGSVTLTAESGYTISGISMTITPKTGGTYNLRTGHGQTDGTGWSSLTEGSATGIANATPGTKSNDIYLVPGDYEITATWTATKGGYSNTYTDRVYTASLVGGKVNTITASLGGDATDINFTVSVLSWGSNAIACGEVPLKKIGTFAGLEITPVSLKYKSGEFIIEGNSWNVESYNSAYGLSEGSYYFLFTELASYFDSRGSSFSASDSGDIDNANTIFYNGHDDWRLPTSNEWKAITTDYRVGSTINGVSGRKYAIIQLTGVTHAGSNTPVGVLLAPDGVSMTNMRELNYWNSTGVTSGITEDELNAYLDEGCIFLPSSGAYGMEGYYWEWKYGGQRVEFHSARGTRDDGSSSRNTYWMCAFQGYFNPVSGASKTAFYLPVRLVRNAN